MSVKDIALKPFERWSRNFLQRRGHDVIRRDIGPHPVRYRMDQLHEASVELVLDVGAHRGTYGEQLRSFGYRGAIISFEPLQEAFARLEMVARADPGWEIYQFALSDRDETAAMHVSGNDGLSSSLLQMLESHSDAAPDSKYVRDETVSVRRLDTIAAEANLERFSNWFLKLDVQGAELDVLRGAAACLGRIAGLQVELSLVPLYESGSSFSKVIADLRDLGFVLTSLEPGFRNETTGEMVQVDGLFLRESKAAANK